MVHAEIVLKDGTKMILDGSPEEIIKIKEDMEKKFKKENLAKDTKKRISSKDGPIARVAELVETDFFNEKRTLGDIKKKLEEKAIFYDVTSLSPSLLRLVKKGYVRRIKENGGWRYVNP